jgi:hypothetical protein
MLGLADARLAIGVIPFDEFANVPVPFPAFVVTRFETLVIFYCASNTCLVRPLSGTNRIRREGMLQDAGATRALAGECWNGDTRFWVILSLSVDRLFLLLV